MRRNNNAKYIVTLESDKNTKHFKILQIVDNRTGEDITDQRFEWAPSLKGDIGMEHDVKESLNLCLYGDSSKYRLKYGQGNKETQLAYAYIFD